MRNLLTSGGGRSALAAHVAPHVPTCTRRLAARVALGAAVLLLLPIEVRAQVNEALTATRVHDFILIKRGANGALRTATVLDPGLARSHPLVDNALFSVPGGKGTNILLDYLNPLRYSWTFDHKAQQEPLAAAVEQFLGSADQLLALVNPKRAAAEGGTAAVAAFASPPPPRAELMATPGTARAAPPAATTADAAVARAFRDIALNEWALWMASRSACMTRQQSSRDQLQRIGARLDSLAYATSRDSTRTTITTAAEFRVTMLGAIDVLQRAATMADLRTALSSAGTNAGRLARANTTLRELITALRTASTAVHDSLESTTDCMNLTAYTRGVMTGVAERAERIATAREGLVSQFREMHAAIAHQVETAASLHDIFLLGHVRPTSKERAHVTVTITERQISTSDDRLEVKPLGTVTGTFEVMEHQSVVTEISVGVAYSAVAYPKFRTNQVGDQHFVADAGIDRPRMVAASMLNLIPNTGWSGFTRLVGQVGIGATTESPLVLVGGGLRLSHDRNLTLSFGAAFPFQKRLKSLKVGDQVAGDAALEQDVERALAKRPAFYLGIQR